MKLDHQNEGSRLTASPRWRGGVRNRRQDESGQAMVEFALILFPLLIIVAGIIQFGIGLNYWLDMQRIANQGARWAAVNNWPPDCPRGSNVGECDGNPNPTLQQSLRSQMLTNGLTNNSTIEICFPAGSKLAGNPVRVQIKSAFKLLPILGVGSLNLKAKATMRLEQSQDPVEGGLITGEASPCSP